jgi:hypothetical protein
MEKNYTVSNNTVASNPGNAAIEPLVWFTYDYKRILLLKALLFGAAYLTIKASWWFAILLVIMLLVNVLYWLRKKEHFRSGDSNGGVVVGTKPTLVAVATGLSKGFGNYPVVKIIKAGGLKNVNLGERIPTVALYTPTENDNDPFWKDFDPVPLKYATKKQEVIDAALETYSEEQWETLQNRLNEIGQPYKPGLYKIRTEDADWEN